MLEDDGDDKQSGYPLPFVNSIHTELIDANKDGCLWLTNVNLKKSAHEFIDAPIPTNVFYPNLDDFKEHCTSTLYFKTHLRNYLEHQMDHENSLDVFEAVDSQTSLNATHSDHSKVSQCTSPDIFCDLVEDEEKIASSQNALQPIEPHFNVRKRLIANIEDFIIKLLQDIISNGNANIRVANTNKWENCQLSNGVLALRNSSELIYRNVNLKRKNSSHQFAMIMYVLSEAYHLLITKTTCTERELYYNDPELVENRLHVSMAVKDVCSILNTSAWDLGIRFSSKGLIAGAIRIYLANNILIDCNSYEEGVLVPSEVQSITYLETTALFILIVEKDTVFEKLLKQNILLNQRNDVILITGKGYPDMSTRLLIAKLWSEFKLPIYALVDADPFGIDIMLVYRFGSRSMAFNSDHLACPHIRWIGIHPSEIDSLAIPSMPQTVRDKRKIIELQQRSYISAEMRNELEILKRLNRKAEIEALTSFSTNFLVSDYIPNKIKRNLCI